MSKSYTRRCVECVLCGACVGWVRPSPAIRWSVLHSAITMHSVKPSCCALRRRLYRALRDATR
eukprot:37895-Eustigmatos_ZCMA.PRE.1